MTNEEIIQGLTKMLDDTREANECGLSNNDFKEDIELLESTISLIKEKEVVIDKMAKYIDMFCDEKISKKLKKDDIAYYGSIYCIKQYFERKAR